MKSNTTTNIVRNAWSHAICATCYNFKFGRVEPYPVRYTERNTHPAETCCWCGSQTRDGVYLKADPRLLDCKH